MKKYKKIFYFLLAIWAIGIVGTMMRHIWIALLITFVLLYFFISSAQKIELRKIIAGFAVVSICVSAIIFHMVILSPQSPLSGFTSHVFEAVLERTQSLENVESDESFSWRNLVWNSAYQDYQKNPLLGIGTGKSIYVESENYQDFIEVRNIHNSYLAILIQLGLLGILLFLLFIYRVVKNLIKFKDANLSAYKFSFLCIISLYLIASFFQPYLETNLLAIFFWMTLGLARVLPEISAEK
jgi:O-antigen ligase